MGCLFVFGIYALARIPKQEFPEYTIRQGVVVGVYPGATAEEVEEQLAKPLEQFLMTYKEVKRSKTTSTSQNGMCYVMVELNDDVNDKDEVWSKIKHGLAAFKMQLPAGVAALVTNDDFGDTSALLITLESDTRSYRELKGYMDDLSDRLRRIESVSNLRPYGVQQEQISVYADHDRLAAYGIGEKVLSAALASQGLTPAGGSVSNGETETPIHIAPSLAGEREVAEQIVWSDPEGHVLRVKDVARVVREYDDPDSYIRNNGHRCVLLSMEMRGGYNIVEYGREVDEVLHAFMEEELPADVSVQRIADQAKVVGDSVHSFLRDLFVAMAIIILVMMLLFPLRSAIVAALTIPMSTFISVGMMYLCGIPLNTVTLAALVVVLGMIVDNSIVVIDGYLDYLGRGHSRWFAAVESAREFFPSLLLAILMAIMISHGQSGLWSGIFASGISITVVYIPQYFRTIRAEVIRIKESAYVESARVVGASTWRIMTKHLFKNSTRTLPVILTLNSSEAILTLAGLGFLGFGIEPTAAAEWGYDLNRAVSDVTAGIWWTAVFPGLAIVLIVLGITLVGESLNDLADPRLRARKSAGEVVGSIEDTSVDPSQEPGKRNEVVAELEAAKNPMGASDKPVTVTDRDPSFVASEWASEEGE